MKLKITLLSPVLVTGSAGILWVEQTCLGSASLMAGESQNAHKRTSDPASGSRASACNERTQGTLAGSQLYEKVMRNSEKGILEENGPVERWHLWSAEVRKQMPHA